MVDSASPVTFINTDAYLQIKLDAELKVWLSSILTKVSTVINVYHLALTVLQPFFRELLNE